MFDINACLKFCVSMCYLSHIKCYVIPLKLYHINIRICCHMFILLCLNICSDRVIFKMLAKISGQVGRECLYAAGDPKPAAE